MVTGVAMGTDVLIGSDVIVAVDTSAGGIVGSTDCTYPQPSVASPIISSRITTIFTLIGSSSLYLNKLTTRDTNKEVKLNNSSPIV